MLATTARLVISRILTGRKVVYQEAIKVLDKAKQLDPEKAQANWGYTRYQAYYGYYGPNAAETKQAEAESK